MAQAASAASAMTFAAGNDRMRCVTTPCAAASPQATSIALAIVARMRVRIIRLLTLVRALRSANVRRRAAAAQLRGTCLAASAGSVPVHASDKEVAMRNPTSHWLLSTMVAAGAAWLCLPANADDPADRQDDTTRTCALTAQRMLKACLFDVGADLQKTLGACMNLPEGQRAACAEEARATRAEEAELCNESLDARQDVCELLDEHRYRDPLAAQDTTFVDPDQIGAGGYAPNPYLSLVEGRTSVFRAGEDGAELVVVTITSETRTILDVECRVAVDVSVEVSKDGSSVEYEPIEVTDDWYAQDSVGNVYYCGELSRNYEDGVLRDLEGSFEAGRDYAKGGYLVKATPAVGTAHRQEYSLGEAEDVVEYVDLN